MDQKELYTKAIARLERAGVYNPEADVRRIFEHALSVKRPDEKPILEAVALDWIEMVLARRERREPLGRIFGSVPFCGLSIRTHEGVFLPYPESEALIEPVLDHFQDPAQPLRILDAGTGTGCLLFAVLREYPAASGIGIDCDGRAIAAAQENAIHLGFASRAEFKLCDWKDDLDQTFDLVLSNPPRVPSGKVQLLLPEMRDHDPRNAFDGGPDGLASFREIAGRFNNWCRPGGCGVFQVSDARAVIRLFEEKASCTGKANPNYMGIVSSVTIYRKQN